VLDSVAEALAAARIVRLIQTDSITETYRKLVLDWLYARKRYRLMELLDCPWCASVHVMAGLTVLRITAPRLHATLVRIMAGSYVASTVVELTGRLTED
jgi:hypothetical protein